MDPVVQESLMSELAYELRRAELEIEAKISAERMQMAMRSRSSRRLEVPIGGLFADQGSLF